MTRTCPACGERLVAGHCLALLLAFRQHAKREHQWGGHKADSIFWPLYHEQPDPRVAPPRAPAAQP